MNGDSVNRNAAFLLALIATVCAVLVAATHELTADRIAENQRQYLARSLAPAIAGISFDNDLLSSQRVIEAPGELPGRGEATVYFATLSGVPVAWLFVVEALDGYAGPIRLLIGIDQQDRVTAVRVLEHRETPGLGDGIEIERSSWIEQFAKRSLIDPEPGGWSIRRDGGEFDQFTGASVTPRSVVRAVHQTLTYFSAHKEALQTPSEGNR
jgi:electron transport complex protein RnfG